MRERLERLGRRWPWFGTALRVQERFGEVHGSQLAAAITLSAFLSLFPLLLVAVAVLGFVAAGSGEDFAAEIISQLGLTGDAARLVEETLASAEDSRRAASIVGLLGLVWAASGLVGTLRQAYNTVWQVTGRGLSGRLFDLLWMAGAAAIFAVSFAAAAVTGWLPGPAAVFAPLVAFGTGLLFWLWTSHTLPNRDVGWKALLPGAVLGAVGLVTLQLLGSVYVPRAVSRSSALYGSLGVVFAVLAWLFFFGRLVVYTAVIDVVRWEEEHGTVTVELEAPRLDGEVPIEATRSGEVKVPE